MSTLRDETIKLAFTHRELRPHLMPLIEDDIRQAHAQLQHRRAYVEPYTWLKRADKGGKDVKKFLEEVGDQKVKNPNPKGRSDEVKIKSLPSTDEGKGFFQKLFDKWKGDGGDSSSDKDESGKELQQLQKKYKSPSDKDKMTFWREVKKDKTRDELIDKDEVNALMSKEFGKALKMYVEHPPASPSKKPSVADIAKNYAKKRNLKLGEALIRLAFARPEFRSAILPLIEAHAGF